MSDTTPQVDAAFTAMFATRSPGERVRMMSEMFETARRLLTAGIRAEQPGITDTELRVQVLLRTYHDDLDSGELEKIAAYIRQRGCARDSPAAG